MAGDNNSTHAATATAPNKVARRTMGKITKVEAARRAMEALGADATRPDIQGYVKQKFGVTMSLDHISNCKSVLAKKAARQKRTAKAARKAAARQLMIAAPSSSPAAPARTVGTNASARATIRLEDVLLTKQLLDRVGAEPLKSLIDGLAP